MLGVCAEEIATSRRLPRLYEAKKPDSVSDILTLEVLNSLPFAPGVPEELRVQAVFSRIEYARPLHCRADDPGGHAQCIKGGPYAG
jgi:hypothetical protein